MACAKTVVCLGQCTNGRCYYSVSTIDETTAIGAIRKRTNHLTHQAKFRSDVGLKSALNRLKCFRDRQSVRDFKKSVTEQRDDHPQPGCV